MMHDPLAPSVGPPPRRVEAWTTVPGHNVSRTRTFCECGAQADRAYSGTGTDWRQEHLGNAWPVLVPRNSGETVGDWMGRLSHALVAASDIEQKLFEREGHGRGLEPGEPIPTITPEMIEAGHRVEVLQHQLDEVRTTFRRRHEAFDE